MRVVLLRWLYIAAAILAAAPVAAGTASLMWDEVIGGNSPTLRRLTFHMKNRGSFSITFEIAFLFDVAVHPRKIPNLVDPWPSGTLVGSWPGAMGER